MNNRAIGFCLLLTAVLSLCSCGGRDKTVSVSELVTNSLRHASLLKISRGDGFTRVDIADPWHSGHTLHTYLLVPSDSDMPQSLPEGTVVRTPLRRAVVATSVHCGLILSMDCGQAIAGVCDPQYINMPEIARGVTNGTIADCGNSIPPTVEKIIDTGADAVILSPFQNSGGYGKLEKTGVPIIEAADYMESSALGRAEWIKFYGMIFGAEQRADSMFAATEQRYDGLAAMARKAGVSRSIMLDRQNGAAWYVAGGQSTIGMMLRDANVPYPFADDKHSGGVPLSFESMLERASQSDVWLIRYNSPNSLTLADIKADKEGYTRFKAWQTGEVYGCNTAHNTFYEDTPFNPDRLLRDFIIICHPDIADRLGQPEYFVKIK